MKKITFIIFLFPSIIFSQFKIDTLKAEGTFLKVFEVEKSKKEIYLKVKEWIAINFRDSNEVLKMDDEDKIITKGYFDVFVVNSGYKVKQKMYFVMGVSIKEKMYKLECSNFIATTSLNGSLIEVKYANYLSSLNYDNYISFLERQSKTNNTAGMLSDKKVNKIYTKILASPKKIDEARNKHIIYEKQITSQVISQTEGISKSMFEFINKTENW